MSEHKSLAEALAAFQGAAPTLHKGEEAKAGAYSYKYVDLAAVVEGIKPLMLEHGLSWSAFPCIGPDGQPALRYKLSHVSGDCESELMPLMLSKPDAQALGSAITYARRYALCAVLNIVADEDDDGAAAKGAAHQQQQVKKTLPPTLSRELNKGYALTGWDRERLNQELALLGVTAVQDLSIEKAQELLAIMSAEVEAPEL